MDIERALFKAGINLAAMFAIYQGTQGMREFAAQRTDKARQDAHTQQPSQDKRDQAESYIESLRLKEAERRQADEV